MSQNQPNLKQQNVIRVDVMNKPLSPTNTADMNTILADDHLRQIKLKAQNLLKGTASFNPNAMEFGSRAHQPLKKLQMINQTSSISKELLRNQQFSKELLIKHEASTKHNIMNKSLIAASRKERRDKYQHDQLQMPVIKRTQRETDRLSSTSKSISHPFSLLALKNVNKSIDAYRTVDVQNSNNFGQRKKYSQQIGITGINYSFDRKRKTAKLMPIRMPDHVMFQNDENLLECERTNIFKDYEPREGQDPDDVIMDIGNPQRKARPKMLKEQNQCNDLQPIKQRDFPFSTRASVGPPTYLARHSIAFDPMSSFAANQSFSSRSRQSRNIFSADTNGSVGTGTDNQNILFVQNSQGSANNQADIQNYTNTSIDFNSSFAGTGHKSQHQQSAQQAVDLTKKTAHFIKKFDELTQQILLQNVLIKIWKLVIKIQYGGIFQAEQMLKIEESKQNKGKKMKKTLKKSHDVIQNQKSIALEQQIPTLPLSLKIYSQCMPQLRKVLGAMYDSDEYIAKEPEYQRENIFFDRFCFDMISLLGKNVFKLSVDNIEYIFRTCYLQLSHSFGASKGGVKFLELNSIVESPFSIQNFQKLDKTLNPKSALISPKDNQREIKQKQIAKRDTLEFQTALKILKDNESAECSTPENMKQQIPLLEKINQLDDKLNMTHADGMNPDPQGKSGSPFTNNDQMALMSQTQNSQGRVQNQTFLLSNKSGSKLNSQAGSMIRLKVIDHLQIESNGKPWSQITSRNDNDKQDSDIRKTVASPGTSSIDTAKRMTMNVSQMLAVRQKKERKRMDAKKALIQKISDHDKNAKSFIPKVEFQEYVEQPVKASYQQMIALKQFKRMNKDQILNGSKTNRTNTAGAIDILGEFDKYDEILFKDDQHKRVLDQFGDSLDSTEYNLIVSNKIERKTILLEAMQAVDQVAQGQGDKTTMGMKQEELVKQLGSKNILEMTSIDSIQKSLDQYDVINPSGISQFAGSLNQASIQVPASFGESSQQDKVIFQENQGLTTERGSQEMNTINEMLGSSATYESQQDLATKELTNMVHKDSEVTYPLASEDNKHGGNSKVQVGIEESNNFQIPNSGASTKLKHTNSKQVNNIDMVLQMEADEQDSLSKSAANIGKSIEQSFENKNKSQSKQEIYGGQITLKEDENIDSSEILPMEENQKYEDLEKPEVQKNKTLNINHIFDQSDFFNQCQTTKNKSNNFKKIPGGRHQYKSKMNVDAMGYQKNSNNDIKHLSLSSQIDLNSSAEHQTGTSAQLKPMFNPKPVFGAKINRKSKFQRNFTNTENSAERKTIEPNLEKLDPQTMNRNDFRKMISQNKQRSRESKPQSPNNQIDMNGSYGNQNDKQMQLKLKMTDVNASSINDSSLLSVGNDYNLFEVKGDSLLKDANNSSLLRQNMNPSQEQQQQLRNLEASVVTFNIMGAQTSQEMQMTSRSRQDGNTSINQSLLENSKADTLFDSQLHNYQCQLDNLEKQNYGVQTVDYQRKMKKAKKKQHQKDSFEGVNFDNQPFQGIITSRQIYATNQILRDEEEMRKKESVEAYQFQNIYNKINKRIENSPREELKGKSISLSIDPSQQMSIEIPVAQNMKPSMMNAVDGSAANDGDQTKTIQNSLTHKHSISRKASIDKQTGISPKGKSRYQVINKKSPNPQMINKREHPKQKDTQINDEDYGSQVESFKRSSNQDLNELLNVKSLKKKDQMNQFNLVIRKDGPVHSSRENVETIASPVAEGAKQPNGGKQFSIQNSHELTLNRYVSNKKNIELQEELTLNLEENDQEQKSDESITQMSKYDRQQQHKTSNNKIVAQSIQLNYGQQFDMRDIVRRDGKVGGPVASLKQIALKDIQDSQVDDLKEQSIIVVSPNQNMTFGTNALLSAGNNYSAQSPQSKIERQIGGQTNVITSSPLKVSLQISNQGDNNKSPKTTGGGKQSQTNNLRASMKSSHEQSMAAEQYNHIQNLIEKTKNINSNSPMFPEAKHPKFCKRMCCVQNELQNQLQIHSRKGTVQLQKTKQFVPSKAPISMVQLDDYNIQSWRGQ